MDGAGAGGFGGRDGRASREFLVNSGAWRVFGRRAGPVRLAPGRRVRSGRGRSAGAARALAGGD